MKITLSREEIVLAVFDYIQDHYGKVERLDQSTIKISLPAYGIDKTLEICDSLTIETK